MELRFGIVSCVSLSSSQPPQLEQQEGPYYKLQQSLFNMSGVKCGALHFVVLFNCYLMFPFSAGQLGFDGLSWALPLPSDASRNWGRGFGTGLNAAAVQRQRWLPSRSPSHTHTHTHMEC